MGLPVRGIEEAVIKVAPGVGIIQGDGLLGTGDDDGLRGVLDQIGQGGGGVSHGVGPMGDDEPVILLIPLLDGSCHLQPVGGAHIGTVQIHQLQGLYPAQAAHRWDVVQDLL